MPASKYDIAELIRGQQKEIEELAQNLPKDAWTRGVHEAGWNAKQLLCHLSESPGVVGFLIGLAEAPPGSGGGMGAGFDIDAFNAQRVAALQNKSISELLTDLRTISERNIAAVEAAPDEVLTKRIKTPWGAEGPVGDVIAGSVREHGGTHLADLRSAGA